MDIVKLEQILNYNFKNKSLLEEASNLSDRLISFGSSTIDFVVSKMINEDLFINSNPFCDIELINKVSNLIKSDDYLLTRADKIHLDEVIYDKKIELLKSIIAAYILDSNDMLKIEEWLNIFDAIVLNLDSNDNYLKQAYLWNKRKYKEYPYISFDGNKAIIKLNEIDKEFIANGNTKFISLNEASKEAYKYLEDNNLLLKMTDIVGYPDQDKCINQLQELFVKGFINEPIYKIAMKGNTNGTDIWKCRIMIEGYKESFSAEDTSKKNAKRIVAFQMLKYIMDLN
ncbi:MAG: hypothetical protein IJS83_05430 [Acholeplasmatales bacterium]|nr:hypothetical protein [Acholeplasmatales bacterium]